MEQTTETYSKEELFYLMAGDVSAAKKALDQARAAVHTASVYERPWWKMHRDQLKEEYYDLRSEFKHQLRMKTIARPQGFRMK